MSNPANQQTRALTQLRMGLLGTATAVIFCFAAASIFSGVPSQAAETEAAPSTE